MKKGNPLGTRLSTILENAQLESQKENIGDLDRILSPANSVNDMVDRHDQAGLNYFRTGHYKEAIEEFKKALSLRPEDSKIHYNLGLTYDTMGHLDEALGEYQKAVQFNSLDAESHNNLGIVYYHKGFCEKAMAEFKGALRIDSNFDLAKQNLKLVEEEG